MSNVEVFVSPPGDSPSSVALSALVHALAETESIGVVRYVKRARSFPHLGVVIPAIKTDYDCLYYVNVPFAEDLRSYLFAPLDPQRMTKKSNIPSA